MSQIHLKQQRQHKYFHDKLLHDYTSLPPDVFESESHRFILLIRRPVESTQSYVRLYRTERPSCDRPDSAIVEEFADYYQKRVRFLADLARQLGKNALLVDAEDLVDNETRTLQHLSTFLDVSPHLSPEFQLFAESGTSGHGDTTGGLRTQRLTTFDHVNVANVDERVAQSLVDTYAKARSDILKALPDQLAGDG